MIIFMIIYSVDCSIKCQIVVKKSKMMSSKLVSLKTQLSFLS